MKDRGIVRKTDRLGRLVLPIEIREALDIKNGEDLCFCVFNDFIQLRKKKLLCVLCGKNEGEIIFKGKKICKECARRVRS